MLMINELTINGFRSFDNNIVNFTPYTILIGKNNSGKSNTLLALKFLLDGSTRDLSDSDFFRECDETHNEIVISARVTGFDDSILALCDDKHRPKIEPCIRNNEISIQRKATREPRKCEGLTIFQPHSNEYGTPTGIEAAFKQFLPEVMFVEAFKVPSDEAVGKSTATLGKLLKVIMEPVIVKGQLALDEALSSVASWLNETEGENIRQEDITRIEGKLKQYIQNVFQGHEARIRFRLPEIGDLIGQASVELNDGGVWTPPENKGQGFQRVLYFALLQTLAEEIRSGQRGNARPFILLFEEPESFLYPSLQKQVGDVLETISSENQVVIATHSPFLVTPAHLDKTLMLRKSIDNKVSRTSIYDLKSAALPAEKKTQQLLGLENSSVFLFSDIVLVVEGPSDRSILNACISCLKETDQNCGLVSLVEAYTKDNVKDFINYLSSLGIKARGVVDVDFLLHGAGACLHSCIELSQLTSMFDTKATSQGYFDDDGKLLKSKRKDAFLMFQSDHDLEPLATVVINKLKDEHDIWVWSCGELEYYFDLNISAKGDYLKVAERIRQFGPNCIHDEVSRMLKWSFS
ncbi:MAG: ATP-dependent nuclease [Anaerolineae bacterium]